MDVVISVSMENSATACKALPLHTINHLPMRTLLLICLCQTLHTPQIPNDILRLSEVDLLQQVSHLELHILNQLSDIRNVACVILNRQIRLDLSRHVSGKIHLAQSFIAGGEREDDGGCELVVRSAGAVNGFKDVDGVPGTFRLAVLWRNYISLA